MYVPFNDDMLPNRLSITLTVILTLVSFTICRPSVIEQLPYPTLHDQYERLMVFFAVVVGLENIFVFQQCVGTFNKIGEQGYPEADERGSYPSYCYEGWCGTSQLDCALLLFIMVSVVGVSCFLFFKGHAYRIREILKVHRGLHEFDADSHRRFMGQLHRLEHS